MALTSVRTYTARSGASATATAGVALAAATAKTAVAVLGAAGTTIGLERVRVSFASATATDAPAIIEIGVITAIGTGGTAFTPVQVSGRALASACTAAYGPAGAWTAEPTYTRVFDSFYAPVFMGHISDWVPLGFEPTCDVSQGFGVRITSPAAATTLVSIFYSE
jgi:hypothetical protein